MRPVAPAAGGRRRRGERRRVKRGGSWKKTIPCAPPPPPPNLRGFLALSSRRRRSGRPVTSSESGTLSLAVSDVDQVGRCLGTTESSPSTLTRDSTSLFPGSTGDTCQRLRREGAKGRKRQSTARRPFFCLFPLL